MKNFIILAIIFSFLFGIGEVAQAQKKSLSVVSSIEISRYAGRWYEIARLPNEFEESCVEDVTTDFILGSNGKFKIVNSCRESDGKLKQAKGTAKQADKDKPNSMLKVTFAPGLFSFLSVVWVNYYIIELAPDYSYTMVGTPDRKYLWILSRTPELDEEIYQRLIEKARSLGFDVSLLQKTTQAQKTIQAEQN